VDVGAGGAGFLTDVPQVVLLAEARVVGSPGNGEGEVRLGGRDARVGAVLRERLFERRAVQVNLIQPAHQVERLTDGRAGQGDGGLARLEGHQEMSLRGGVGFDLHVRQVDH
jgi:hypothetical protein